MSDEKFTVLFASADGKNPYHDLLSEGLKQHGVTAFYQPFPILLPLTRSVVKNEDIDVIHLGWLYRFYLVYDYTPSLTIDAIVSAIRAILFCIDLIIVKILNVKIVWTVHNKYHHEKHHLWIEKLLNVFVANFVHELTVKCNYAKQTVCQFYRIQDESKITIIPDGNYIDAYPNNVDKKEARNYLGIDNKFVYLYFGQIRPYKGVEQLINSFNKIEADGVELWIVGNPKTETIHKRVHSQAKENNEIHTVLEFVPDDEVQYYMNAANVLVLPYQDILNSGSVYLGLSFGKAIIAPKIGCIPSLVPTKNNILYNIDNKYGLTNSLKNIRYKNIQDIEKANFQEAKELDWESIGSKYANLYKSDQ